MSTAIIFAATLSVVFLFMFILNWASYKKFPVVSFILLLVALVILAIAVLEYFKVFDLGVTKVGNQASAFYVKNTIYFQIGWAILLIIQGTIFIFGPGHGKVSTIFGILAIALGAFVIVDLILELQGITIFNWFKLIKDTTSESEVISESAKALL